MKTTTAPRVCMRKALKLLFASAVLLVFWSTDVAANEPLASKDARAEPSPSQSTQAQGKAPLLVITEKPAATEAEVPADSETVRQLKQALSVIGAPSNASQEPSKRITLTNTANTASTRAPSSKRDSAADNRAAVRARAMALANGQKPGAAHSAGAKAHSEEVHWSYEGENGPENWGKLKPEFNVCASGKRQSPIAIRDDITLVGPAEPIGFMYTPSRGNVVNNGHTIQVNVEGENSITVRGSTYKLLQFHFHTPSEEMINSKRYAMVAHLVHKNEAGQLAVVAVLMEPGEPSPFLDTVWTYLPLDTSDQVNVPEGVIDMNQILPADQRYYQFLGSLTTPPCTEGVLWMVIKQPLRISAAQYKLFTQLFAHNARPVQPINGRPIREAR